MGETLTDASLSTLERVDGSATYSHNGYMIIAAVNGPIEVQRKDGLPEEAVVDVTVRLAAGIGGILFLEYNLDSQFEIPSRSKRAASRVPHPESAAPRDTGRSTSTDLDPNNTPDRGNASGR